MSGAGLVPTQSKQADPRPNQCVPARWGRESHQDAHNSKECYQRKCEARDPRDWDCGLPLVCHMRSRLCWVRPQRLPSSLGLWIPASRGKSSSAATWEQRLLLAGAPHDALPLLQLI